MKKITSGCLIFLLLVSVTHVALAKPQSDWSNLKNFVGQAVAINTADGVTWFGALGFVDDSEIAIQLADDERVSAREQRFRRPEVTKVWRATLRFGETNTGKGALIGLGIGLGAGYVTALVLAQRDSGPPHGVGLFPIAGVIAGAAIGASKTKDHKKKKLIYSI